MKHLCQRALAKNVLKLGKKFMASKDSYDALACLQNCKDMVLTPNPVPAPQCNHLPQYIF